MQRFIGRGITVVTAVLFQGLGSPVLFPTPVVAQPSFVSALLQAITVRIIVTNTVTGQQALCHGYVHSVRHDVAYVVTAGHCIEDLAPLSPQLPAGFIPDAGEYTIDLPSTRSYTSPLPLPYRSLNDLSIAVRYADGTTGTLMRGYHSWSEDVYVIAASWSGVVPPRSWLGGCEEPYPDRCHVYGPRSFGYDRGIPVMSILSAGGGPSVVSSGLAIVNGAGQYLLLLPSAPGTSGAPVLDMRGALVGVVVSSWVLKTSEAGWDVNIVLGSDTYNLFKFACQC